jgi:hypothetical protein
VINAHQGVTTKAIWENTRGIVFLGTPHGGSELAKSLHRLLMVSFSKRIFVGQLKQNSSIIREITEGFNTLANSIQMISFIESQQTRPVAVGNVLYKIS